MSHVARMNDTLQLQGQVSLYCHSLGSVIMFDLLQKQRQVRWLIGVRDMMRDMTH